MFYELFITFFIFFGSLTYILFHIEELREPNHQPYPIFF